MMSEFGFVYDSSMLAPFSNVPVWPYTLDYRPPHNCVGLEQLCPTRAYPGVWELPINQLLAGVSFYNQILNDFFIYDTISIMSYCVYIATYRILRMARKIKKIIAFNSNTLAQEWIRVLRTCQVKMYTKYWCWILKNITLATVRLWVYIFMHLGSKIRRTFTHLV